ncbi:beta-galactosidase [Pelagicoccus mobilis]|uniref:Beta-galactosidase n=1 Tax=Pelagicoccus mobilis TaxID=415221 RepID=A0A934VSW6_9BACT|nr:beta-galactosidase [Pelagicoccus mobilis]MBK1879440.1 beta-galactosidase [Pelagicoccus mobilis]
MYSNGSVHETDSTEDFETKLMLANFEGKNVPELLVTNASNGEIIQTGSSHAFKVSLATSSNKWAGLELKPSQPLDLSKMGPISLVFDAASLGEHTTQLFINITDKNGASHSRSAVIRSGKMNTYYAVLSSSDLKSDAEDETVELNLASGMRSNPPPFNTDAIQTAWLWGTKNLDLSGISLIKLSSMNSSHNKELLIDNIRIAGNPPYHEDYLTGILDEFGQAAKKDFEGKVNSVEELRAARDTELASFKEKPFTNRSKYGGWKDGPKLEATGYFRAAKHNGKWSLVDPDGYLYLATGVAVIRLGDTSTMTGLDRKVYPSDEDHSKTETHVTVSPVRRNLFQWLPDSSDPLSKHYHYARGVHSGAMDKGISYNFYEANLERKYGDNYHERWREVTIDRMLNWGFTSLGNWTEPGLYNNDRIPYFANAWITGEHKTVSSGNDFWHALPDVFDPAWEKVADKAVRKVAKETQGNSWCVGVFIDNEISFGRPNSQQTRYGIPIHTLQRDGNEVPTKAAFTRAMQEKYSSIEALNTVWETNISSWDAFNRGFDSTINNQAQVADYALLLELYASKYYETIAASMDTHLPNHLYLGSRMPDWGMPMEAVRGAAKHVDVLSFNLYKESLFHETWAFLEEMDMPSIIGEYSIGSTNDGHYHFGIIDAEDQEDRATKFVDYLDSLIANPYFIGAHWFQYIDSNMTGRVYDGENYNNGFIRVSDIPYQPMVDASQEFHKDLYEKRFRESNKL